MKNNKKVRDVLNSIQEFTQKEELKDPFHSGLTKSEKSQNLNGYKSTKRTRKKIKNQ